MGWARSAGDEALAAPFSRPTDDAAMGGGCVVGARVFQLDEKRT